MGSSIGDIKGDTRSLDYSSDVSRFWKKVSGFRA